MKSGFASPLAGDLDAFLAFQRSRGYKYARAEFTLRSFDRFWTRARRRKRSPELTAAIVEWLGSRPARQAISVAQDLSVIRAFWSYLRRKYPRRYRHEPNWPQLPKKSTFVPFVLTTEQVRTLLRLIAEPGGYQSVLYRALFLVLYCTGLRPGEALRLRVRDVVLPDGVLFIADSKGRSRWVPFDTSLRRELARYRRERRAFATERPGDPFFVREDGSALPVQSASYALRRLFRRAGLKPERGRHGPRPYDLRHTFAVHRLTRWYRQGVDLHARLPWLSAYLGHLDVIGTEVYLTATPELLALAGHRFRRRYVKGRKR
jgi:site-specific recombinase XerD